MVKSDTVYEYKKIKPLEIDSAYNVSNADRELKNRLNEVIVEQNQMAKDFELYKKAHKRLKIDTDILESRINDLEGRVK